MKIVFLVPDPVEFEWHASARRRIISTYKVLAARNNLVSLLILEENIKNILPDKDALYIVQLYWWKIWWPWINKVHNINYIIDIPESILTAQKDYLKYASFLRKIRFIIARIIYFLICNDPLVRVKKILANSRGIVCASELQKLEFEKLNKNVTYIWDSINEEYNITKNHLSDTQPSVVWEGGGSTLFQIAEIKNALQYLQKTHNLKIIIVSDDIIYHPKFGKLNTKDYLNSLGLNTEFYKWEIDSFCNNILKGNIGIAPLAVSQKFYFQKGANKVQVLNFLGLPIIGSDIPAYRDWITNGSNGFIARGENEWISSIEKYILHPEWREIHGKHGRIKALKNCNPIKISEDWEIFILHTIKILSVKAT